MSYTNWQKIHKAYTKLNWQAIEAIYESAKHCPHTWSAYKHAMSIFPFPSCLLNSGPKSQPQPKPNFRPQPKPSFSMSNAEILAKMSCQLGIKLPGARGIAKFPKQQLLGHIWWHWQNKVNKISHAKLAKIADNYNYAHKVYELYEFFDVELSEIFSINHYNC